MLALSILTLGTAVAFAIAIKGEGISHGLGKCFMPSCSVGHL